jgi:hypothetical protein
MATEMDYVRPAYWKVMHILMKIMREPSLFEVLNFQFPVTAQLAISQLYNCYTTSYTTANVLRTVTKIKRFPNQTQQLLTVDHCLITTPFNYVSNDDYSYW